MRGKGCTLILSPEGSRSKVEGGDIGYPASRLGRLRIAAAAVLMGVWMVPARRGLPRVGMAAAGNGEEGRRP